MLGHVEGKKMQVGVGGTQMKERGNRASNPTKRLMMYVHFLRILMEAIYLENGPLSLFQYDYKHT